MAEQLARVGGLDRRVEVEDVGGAPDGLGWRTRVAFAVDRDGVVGLRRHRSHELEPVATCPIATDGVNAAGVGPGAWPGARQLEVLASPDGGPPVVLVDTGKPAASTSLPDLDVGLVVEGPDAAAPGPRRRSWWRATGSSCTPGVFWQVHPRAADGPHPGGARRPGARARGSGRPTSTPAPGCSRWPWPGPSGRPARSSRWSGAGPAVADLAHEHRRARPGGGGPRRCGPRPGAPAAWADRTWSSSTRPGPGPGAT